MSRSGSQHVVPLGAECAPPDTTTGSGAGRAARAAASGDAAGVPSRQAERTCMSWGIRPRQGQETTQRAASAEWPREGGRAQLLSFSSAAGRNPSAAGLRTRLAPGPRSGSRGGRGRDHSG